MIYICRFGFIVQDRSNYIYLLLGSFPRQICTVILRAQNQNVLCLVERALMHQLGELANNHPSTLEKL